MAGYARSASEQHNVVTRQVGRVGLELADGTTRDGSVDAVWVAGGVVERVVKYAPGDLQGAAGHAEALEVDVHLVQGLLRFQVHRVVLGRGLMHASHVNGWEGRYLGRTGGVVPSACEVVGGQG